MADKTKVGRDNRSDADNHRGNPRGFAKSRVGRLHWRIRSVPQHVDDIRRMIQVRNIDHKESRVVRKPSHRYRARGLQGNSPRPN